MGLGVDLGEDLFDHPGFIDDEGGTEDAHVGTTVGGSIGVVDATCTMDHAIERTQTIIEAVKKSNPDTFFLAHGGPINTPEDVRIILDNTDAHGFVGASSIERMGVEQSLTDLTRAFKTLSLSR